MARLNPYLHFDGNAEEAFNYYARVFGTQISMVMRYKDAPANQPFDTSEHEKIMHITLPIGDGNALMGSDMPGKYGPPVKGNAFVISIDTNSEAEADNLFTGLSEGGKVMMPIGKTFWNAYFGMMTDKFGVQWMVSYEYSQP